MRIRTRCQQCQNTTVPSYEQHGSPARKRAIQERDCRAPARGDLKILHLRGARLPSFYGSDRIPVRIIAGGRADPLENLIPDHGRRAKGCVPL